MVSFSADEWILLISFILIFGAFFAYDLFKRGEKYGYFAYIAALLPANYLWYIACKDGRWLDFGAMGAMMVLAILWNMCVLRDILIKNKKEKFKDADDVALLLLISLALQFILDAVLPPINAQMKVGSGVWLKFFYVPDFNSTTYGATFFWGYKIFASLLTLVMIIAIIVDLKGEKVPIQAIIVITAIFAAPFAFLAFLWAPQALGAMLFLICVIFFLLMLGITKGQGSKK